MGSLSFGEILTILVIILIIFGPKRLPEFARKTGELIAWARKSLRDFTESIEGELGEGTQPLADLKREFDGARNDLTGTINSIGGSGTPQPTAPSETGDEAEPTVEGTETQSSEEKPSEERGSDVAADDPPDPSSEVEDGSPSDDSTSRDPRE